MDGRTGNSIKRVKHICYMLLRTKKHRKEEQMSATYHGQWWSIFKIHLHSQYSLSTSYVSKQDICVAHGIISEFNVC